MLIVPRQDQILPSSAQKPPRHSTIDEQHELAPDRLCWLVNQGTGATQLRDLTRRGNTGVLTNMDASTDWVASERGWALDFDGSNDQIIATHNGSLDIFDGDFSVAFWLRSPETSNTVLVEKGIAYNNCTMMFYTNDDGHPLKFALDWDATECCVYDGAILDDEWHHVVGTAEKTNGTSTLRLYIDGVKVDTTTSVTIPTPNILNLFVAARTGGAVATECEIAQFLVYGRRLLDVQAKQLYHQPYCFVRTPAPRWFPFFTAVTGNVTVTPAALALTGAGQAPVPAVTKLLSALTGTVAVQAPVPAVTHLPSAQTATGALQTPVPAVTHLPSAQTLAGALASPTLSVTQIAQALSLAAAVQTAIPAVTHLPSAQTMTGAVQTPVPEVVQLAAALGLTATAQGPTIDRLVAIAAALTMTAGVQTPTVSLAAIILWLLEAGEDDLWL